MCANEAELGIPIPMGINMLAMDKLNKANYLDIGVYSKRYTAEDAKRI